MKYHSNMVCEYLILAALLPDQNICHKAKKLVSLCNKIDN